MNHDMTSDAIAWRWIVLAMLIGVGIYKIVSSIKEHERKEKQRAKEAENKRRIELMSPKQRDAEGKRSVEKYVESWKRSHEMD